jgi:hypothetical protein
MRNCSSCQISFLAVGSSQLEYFEVVKDVHCTSCNKVYFSCVHYTRKMSYSLTDFFAREEKWTKYWKKFFEDTLDGTIPVCGTKWDGGYPRETLSDTFVAFLRGEKTSVESLGYFTETEISQMFYDGEMYVLFRQERFGEKEVFVSKIPIYLREAWM